ncbi:hypothetical protein SEA_VIBAKI_67 [Arthrobacter phage Vibaki]|uniref:Uncharacterized protein n=1 Tax=Arthrobacter phage Vibaki TaxID=2593333 RepID=A0A514TZ41_9CAUD|nr:hypothetical protein HYP95_gp67 [Arthrobacter phage Vibaki]QDK01947.1 hypothetical protein SEA_VIBAKI_67 [Arthrobacter phage Vibaki]
MKGYGRFQHGRGAEYFYRPVEQTAGALIEALAVLPPDTLIETTAGYDGVTELAGVWYYPATKTASLG